MTKHIINKKNADIISQISMYVYHNKNLITLHFLGLTTLFRTLNLR